MGVVNHARLAPPRERILAAPILDSHRIEVFFLAEYVLPDPVTTLSLNNTVIDTASNGVYFRNHRPLVAPLLLSQHHWPGLSGFKIPGRYLERDI